MPEHRATLVQDLVENTVLAVLTTKSFKSLKPVSCYKVGEDIDHIAKAVMYISRASLKRSMILSGSEVIRNSLGARHGLIVSLITIHGSLWFRWVKSQL